MRTKEHVALQPPAKFFLNALILDRPKNELKTWRAWYVLNRAIGQTDQENRYIALADAVSQTIEARREKHSTKLFQRAYMFVGDQGAGKDYIAKHMRPLGFKQITMSDIVMSVAPALGYDPKTTDGKIRAGDSMRRIFGKQVFADLGFYNALENGVKRVVMTGPRSSLEIRAARKYGARVIGMIADHDKKIDRAVRLERATKPRKLASGEVRIMTTEDFNRREKTERPRIRRLLKLVDKVVVNNRNPREVIRELLA